MTSNLIYVIVFPLFLAYILMFLAFFGKKAFERRQFGVSVRDASIVSIALDASHIVQFLQLIQNDSRQLTSMLSLCLALMALHFGTLMYGIIRERTNSDETLLWRRLVDIYLAFFVLFTNATTMLHLFEFAGGMP